MWPGYGENCRVLEWILLRIDDEPGTAMPTPIGNVPTREKFNLEGLQLDFDGLFDVPTDFWLKEVNTIYYNIVIPIKHSCFFSRSKKSPISCMTRWMKIYQTR